MRHCALLCSSGGHLHFLNVKLSARDTLHNTQFSSLHPLDQNKLLIFHCDKESTNQTLHIHIFPEEHSTAQVIQSTNTYIRFEGGWEVVEGIIKYEM
jgi:hypothetical protein